MKKTSQYGGNNKDKAGDSMATIYELAKLVGYAPSTVSKVLNGYPSVSEQTREKILKAAKEHNFVPNMNARALISKRSYMIGALVLDGPNDILSPHLAEILSAFKFRCASQGYDITFLSNRVGKNHVTYKEHCLLRNLDGILLAIGLDSLNEGHIEQVQELLTLDLPKVSVEEFHENVSTVVSDNIGGAVQGLDYLYSLGHRNIGIVTVAGPNTSSEHRLEGYRRFLCEKGLPFDEKNVFPAREYSFQAGAEIAEKVAENRSLTALLCVYDEITLGLIQGLRQQGICVPDDLSIVSFDDIMIAKYDGLTTVRQNREKIGTLAAEKLIGLIEGSDTVENKLIDTELIVRSTCRSLL